MMHNIFDLFWRYTLKLQEMVDFLQRTQKGYTFTKYDNKEGVKRESGQGLSKGKMEAEMNTLNVELDSLNMEETLIFMGLGCNSYHAMANELDTFSLTNHVTPC